MSKLTTNYTPEMILQTSRGEIKFYRVPLKISGMDAAITVWYPPKSEGNLHPQENCWGTVHPNDNFCPDLDGKEGKLLNFKELESMDTDEFQELILDQDIQVLPGDGVTIKNTSETEMGE